MATVFVDLITPPNSPAPTGGCSIDLCTPPASPARGAPLASVSKAKPAANDVVSTQALGKRKAELAPQADATREAMPSKFAPRGPKVKGTADGAGAGLLDWYNEQVLDEDNAVENWRPVKNTAAAVGLLGETVRKLKSILDARGVSYHGVIEKSELERLVRQTEAAVAKKAAPAPQLKKPVIAKKVTVSWEEALKRWAAPLTAASAASATEQKVRWLLSGKAEAVQATLKATIDKKLDNWRPGKDCSCEREEVSYGRGECPCGEWDCSNEDGCGDGCETHAEMRDRCLDVCDEREDWEDAERDAMPNKLGEWVKKVLRLVVVEAGAKPDAVIKESMLKGARAAIVNFAAYNEAVQTALEALCEELDELNEPEEEEACQCCDETDCEKKDNLHECEHCGEAVHEDMIVGDSGEFCETCDLVNMRPGCPCHRRCLYSRSQRLFECQDM